MSDKSNTVEDTLGPKCGVILEACEKYVRFQRLVWDHHLTGKDIAKGMALINVNEQALVAGGATV